VGPRRPRGDQEGLVLPLKLKGFLAGIAVAARTMEQLRIARTVPRMLPFISQAGRTRYGWWCGGGLWVVAVRWGGEMNRRWRSRVCVYTATGCYRS
jgi:hypothetical protein